MNQKLQKAEKEIAEYREEIIEKLVQYSLTDMLLFWGQEEDLIDRQEKLWGPLLQWASDAFNARFVKTQGLDVLEENKESGYRLKIFMESLSNKELAAFYLAALNMRSVLLAAALVKGHINADEAFRAAFVEELWQSENWGTDEETQKKRDEMKEELKDIELFLKDKKA